MTIDWSTTPLAEQLTHYHLLAPEAVRRQLTPEMMAEVSQLQVHLTDLDNYAKSWGVKAGVWLVLAVARMLKEILADYSLQPYAQVPLLSHDQPGQFTVVALDSDQQEIGHRIVTAYNEIYTVLLRTHGQSGNRFWHRQAVTTYFPQLMIKVEDDSTLLDEENNIADE